MITNFYKVEFNCTAATQVVHHAIHLI